MEDTSCIGTCPVCGWVGEADEYERCPVCEQREIDELLNRMEEGEERE
jgi:rubrerythrin